MTTAAAGVLFLLILVLLVLAMLIGAIMLFVRGSSGTRWIVGTGVLLFVLIGPIMLYMSLADTRHAVIVAEQQSTELRQRQAAIAVAEAPRQAPRPGASGGSEAWRHAADHFLVADHYPSAAAAARGLAVEIEPLLDTVAGDINVEIHFPNTQVSQAMADVLVARNPRIDVEITTPGNEQPFQRRRERAQASERSDASKPLVRIYLNVVDVHILQNESERLEGQYLEATVSGPGNFTRSARFVDKPWVEDFNAFVSAADRGTYILAQSTEPALHAGEAQAMAISDAAQQITAHAQARVLSEQRYGSINTTRLHQQIVVALNEGRFIEDRFVQAFERPGGKVYQAWLLIEVDQGVLDEMAREQFIAARHQQYRYFSSAGGAVVMLIVVLVLYGFLNAATKGYYATGLKVAAGAVMVLGVVWLVLVA